MWNFDKLCYCWQREPLERPIFSLAVWCAPVTAAVLFHADKCCLSFDPLWRSILTDWAAIMSSLAVRAARSFCFAHQVFLWERTWLSQSMTKCSSSGIFQIKSAPSVTVSSEKAYHAVNLSESLYVPFRPLWFAFTVAFIWRVIVFDRDKQLPSASSAYFLSHPASLSTVTNDSSLLPGTITTRVPKLYVVSAIANLSLYTRITILLSNLPTPNPLFS